MRTFFNVLFRKILYKIPLKFLLLLLAIVSVFIACFSNAGLELSSSYTLDQHYQGYTFNNTGDLICVTLNSCNYYNSLTFMVSLSDENGETDTANAVTVSFANQNHINQLPKGMGYCTMTNWIKLYNGYEEETCNVTFSTYVVSDYTSLQCQTEYNLIPINSVDSAYCESNNLCPSGGGSPSDCPNIGVSNLFINDVFHPGAFNVIVNIPEEIDWDYAYTNSGNNFNLDIVGYNVDYTKVQDQIDIQNYKPSTDELSSIISGIIPLFIPGLVIILFLYFVFRFIKKIF